MKIRIIVIALFSLTFSLKGHSQSITCAVTTTFDTAYNSNTDSTVCKVDGLKTINTCLIEIICTMAGRYIFNTTDCVTVSGVEARWDYPNLFH